MISLTPWSLSSENLSMSSTFVRSNSSLEIVISCCGSGSWDGTPSMVVVVVAPNPLGFSDFFSVISSMIVLSVLAGSTRPNCFSSFFSSGIFDCWLNPSHLSPMRSPTIQKKIAIHCQCSFALVKYYYLSLNLRFSQFSGFLLPFWSLVWSYQEQQKRLQQLQVILLWFSYS